MAGLRRRHPAAMLIALLLFASLHAADAGDMSVATAGAPARAVYWPRAKLMKRIANVRVRVEGRVIRIDPATVVCGGEGRPRVVKGIARWRRFRCIQPTFPPGVLVGPDAIFLVHPMGRTRFRITDAHFARY